MDIIEVADIVNRVASGFEEACMSCLDEHRDFVVTFIQEQLYSGVDGEEKNLSPSYDDDPFFNEAGVWHNRAKDYKEWKLKITPPRTSNLLGLRPRLVNIPNLFIDGTFFNEITASRQGNSLFTSPGLRSGPDIVSKYGDNILDLGPTAIDYFNEHFLLPALETFIKKCGYR